jgi:septum formation protein
LKARPLVLASGSPQRRRILTEHRVAFRVVVSHVSENHPRPCPPPSSLVRHLALKKGLSVAQQNQTDTVLAADTLVFLDGKPIGKPRDAKDGARILRKLSGRWQDVYTGVAVVWDGGARRLLGVGRSRVLFKTLSEAEIVRAASQNLDKAGGYAVQEKKDGFVERISGDYDNVVGLPMRVVKKLLLRRGRAHALTKRI